jgi:hypothetical protein
LELTHDELLAKIDSLSCCSGTHELALKAVVELHKPDDKGGCAGCPPDREYFYESMKEWPCPTIRAIEKELG